MKSFLVIFSLDILIFQTNNKMITRADCPSKIADPYPGKRSKNNPAGSLLTRKEYVEKQVQDWIEHFKDSEQYQHELVTSKVRYLVQHLKVFNMTYKAALKLLVELESRLTETDADGEVARFLKDQLVSRL